jgi:hypothetical protein
MRPTMAFLLLVAMRPTLTFLLLVNMQRNNTGLPTVGCYATNTGLLTVGYHATQQHRPSYCWLLCDQHLPSYCWLPCNATIPAFLLLVAMRPTLAFLLLVAMVTNSTGLASVSLPTLQESRVCMGVFNLPLPSNDGLQSNTSQHSYRPSCCGVWGLWATVPRMRAGRHRAEGRSLSHWHCANIRPHNPTSDRSNKGVRTEVRNFAHNA